MACRTVTVYQVGPRGQEHPKHPWVMTGEKAVAEAYAEEMNGQVTERHLVSAGIKMPTSWHGGR